ncbi:conserved Plasmodium protein, unknown function [Plasmodium knowlesi strain H]|uniref:Thioredoxin domain-containing protein n=3 Tax=Plasmodium knowlesi TaxID=5850 RepID=A0A5K1UJ94_PLAKH|nr:conserved Plasmodium protein, unknown function [Plasmodium knowlesi strain H]OTN64245.1 Uncharacterized protein PKNOH_S140271600 [Plasmodium knowlesi]CAA9991130.1 conserved Plasmodium protein, unknown function [Plasmodium knowlesi strain H]SBO20555.1 conserved Plasmodium protein, unknown function [Plasmodium knowlesi strain H]SBO20939.1 conserved Plasmodium protein, unknown function [Plasmodium knowlesi strain H]VVS80604.1 conserved Plasmodium protein, unknown function [Plasmodium knowlesi |eukprot:XP_002262414.1 hypothetical protein, conserved in Plasmodium species [Plasmodium knowlesi strain H]
MGKIACTSQAKTCTSTKELLEILQNDELPSVIMDQVGTFTRMKEKQNLLYERILFKPTSFSTLSHFMEMIEKENLRREFDMYFYDEDFHKIKLNRDQNRKELFIDIRGVHPEKHKSLGGIYNPDGSVKTKCTTTQLLQKYSVEALHYYNIQRYEPNQDPSSFLIDKRRLTKEEYRYQYVSTILPYICFTLMLFFPHALICLYIPYMKEKNEKQRKICKFFQIKQHVHMYKDIRPEHLQNVIDNNVKTLVFFYNNEIFMNMRMKSLMVDLSRILKKNSIPVNVVGVDTAKHNIRYGVAKDFEEVLFPVIYLICPYHYDNDSGVFRIEGPLTLESICSQIAQFVHVPRNAFSQMRDLTRLSDNLQKCIFEHEVMNQKKDQILYDYGTEIAHLSCLHLNGQVPF